jgi:iron complex outermembrane receptor protein
MRPLLVFLLVVLAAPSTSAQTPNSGVQASARIRGSVKDATGAPLANVAVTLTGATRRDAQTGREGEFEFAQLSEGDYELVASLAGFASATRAVRLTRAETATISLALAVQFTEHTVVTAGKAGERDVQDTPIAMSVVQARELERQQIRNIEDLARLAPAVTFSQNTGFAQLTIRGIGTNAIFTGSDPSSAVYLDGVYIARPAMVLADFLDVERVEVLRGPQGTLYGRNAVGGAVNVIMRSPANDVRASARFAAGSFDTLRGEASVSGPIVRERLMGSVAVLRGGARGFVRDLNHAGQYLGGQDVTAALGKLRFVMNGKSELEWSSDLTRQDPTPLTYAKVLAVKPGFQVDNPAALHEVRTTDPGHSRNLQFGSSLRFTAQLTPRTTVTSLTAFRKIDYDVFVDVDITELDLAVSDTHEIQRQWSEELTVAYQRPGFLWLGGVFLFDDRDRQWSVIELGAARLDNRLHPTVDSNSKAMFSQATVGLTTRVSATAGVRYTHEQKGVRNEGQVLTLDQPVTLIPGSTYSYSDALSHHAWTPRLALEFRANERMLTYVSATRGFKSGGFNASSREAGHGFAPEWAWTYEAGLKTDLGRTRVNLAAFHTDYTNLQVQIAIRPGVLDISNAAAATIKGVEAEVVSDIVRWVRAGGYVNWLDARYQRYTAVGVGGVTGDAAGHRLNNAPEWSTRLWLEWKAEAGVAGTLSLRPEVLWQSTAFFTPFNDTVQRQTAYATANMSAELQMSRRYSLAAYVRNLANQDYITGTFSSPPPAIGGRPGVPRQFGVEFTVRR